MEYHKTPYLVPHFYSFILVILKGLKSGTKLFADGTSLFSVIDWADILASTLKNDLTVIQNSVYQLKMFFNTDKTKQAQEVLFSRTSYSYTTLL